MPPSPDVLLQADAVEVAYGDVPVVRGLSLDLQAGTFVGLIGPNGAGKTTLLLALSGQFRPRRGTVRFHGRDVYADDLAFKRRIGYAHEHPFFYPYLTAEEWLLLVARIKGDRAAQAPVQIAAALDAVHLGDERRKPAAHLSTGMRKKLALAAALVGAPEVVFLDEALNGVDVESAFAIKGVLRDYVARGGTVVLSTHVLEVIEKYCDRYIVMQEGAVAADVGSERFRAEARSGAFADLEQYVIHLLRR
jgi:ABC-2 type transport system ATP-binding protein